MKFKAMILLSVFYALTLTAQQSAHYTVTNLGSLGGNSARGRSINDVDWVTGYSNLTPGGQNVHAALWAYGHKLDLGTLGGPNSAVTWPNHNDFGRIVGIAETADLDPNGEAWSCSEAIFPVATGHICLGFVWKNGHMTALPTLGGTNGFATGANNQGQVVGWAETTYHDPTCNLPQVLQFLAVIWQPEKGTLQQLNPLPGDSDTAATSINDGGQVVGISGICANAVGGLSAAHMALWQNGTVTEIPNLGGVAWNTPMDINSHGDVVGFSDLPGDSADNPNFHAFLWTKSGGTIDLGTLPGDPLSEALGINDRGQVVGLSFGGANGQRAFLWENGVMTNLNTLVSTGLQLRIAEDINNRGKITGKGFDPGTGLTVAFVAAPASH